MTIEKRKSKGKINTNARLQFKQSIIHQEYIEHLYGVFKEYCNKSPIKLEYLDNRPNKMKKYESLKFQTANIPCFNYYYELFYNDGKKLIPKKIGEHLTARGLAYWIMDDGYKSQGGLYICTESFNLEDQKLLVLPLNPCGV